MVADSRECNSHACQCKQRKHLWYLNVGATSADYTKSYSDASDSIKKVSRIMLSLETYWASVGCYNSLLTTVNTNPRNRPTRSIEGLTSGKSWGRLSNKRARGTANGLKLLENVNQSTIIYKHCAHISVVGDEEAALILQTCWQMRWWKCCCHVSLNVHFV